MEWKCVKTHSIFINKIDQNTRGGSLLLTWWRWCINIHRGRLESPVAQSSGGLRGPLVESGDEGRRSPSSWDPGQQAGWDTTLCFVWKEWALHSPAAHWGVLPLPPGPGEPMASWSHPLQVLLPVCLGGGPGRPASPPVQLVMGGNSPCGPQPPPELTAVLRARPGRCSLMLVILGLLFINYIHSYPCLLVKFSFPL